MTGEDTPATVVKRTQTVSPMATASGTSISVSGGARRVATAPGAVPSREATGLSPTRVALSVTSGGPCEEAPEPADSEPGAAVEAPDSAGESTGAAYMRSAA